MDGSIKKVPGEYALRFERHLKLAWSSRTPFRWRRA